jgi:hypothetical protein
VRARARRVLSPLSTTSSCCRDMRIHFALPGRQLAAPSLIEPRWAAAQHSATGCRDRDHTAHRVAARADITFPLQRADGWAHPPRSAVGFVRDEKVGRRQQLRQAGGPCGPPTNSASLTVAPTETAAKAETPSSAMKAEWWRGDGAAWWGGHVPISFGGKDSSRSSGTSALA